MCLFFGGKKQTGALGVSRGLTPDILLGDLVAPALQSGALGHISVQLEDSPKITDIVSGRVPQQKGRLEYNFWPLLISAISSPLHQCRGPKYVLWVEAAQ